MRNALCRRSFIDVRALPASAAISTMDRPRSRPRTQRMNHNAIPVLPRSNAIAAAARVFPVFSKTRYRSADVIVACRSRKSSAALVRRKTLGGDTVPRLGLSRRAYGQATRLQRSRQIFISREATRAWRPRDPSSATNWRRCSVQLIGTTCPGPVSPPSKAEIRRLGASVTPVIQPIRPPIYSLRQ